MCNISFEKKVNVIDIFGLLSKNNWWIVRICLKAKKPNIPEFHVNAITLSRAFIIYYFIIIPRPAIVKRGRGW